MERLTEKDAYWFGEEFWVSAKEPDDEEIDAVYMKLAEYEELEEQGVLVRLPCKVGEKIYCIEEYEDGCEYSIYLYMASCKDFVIVAPRYSHCDIFDKQLEEMHENSQEWNVMSVRMFSRKKVFLTKEEAEKALERMGKKDEFC